MTAEEYLKENNFANIAIRNKFGIQAYMLSDVLDDYAEQQIRELKEKTCHADWWKENDELHKQIKELKEKVDELKELLKVSICPNKRCVDGTIEVGNYIEQGLEQCQFCDERKQALK